MQNVAALTQLEALDLSDLKITSVGLTCLDSMTHLRMLSLRGTKVTGEGLVHLRGLKQLRPPPSQRCEQRLILGQLARDEKIAVSPVEIDAEIQRRFLAAPLPAAWWPSR